LLNNHGLYCLPFCADCFIICQSDYILMRELIVVLLVPFLHITFFELQYLLDQFDDSVRRSRVSVGTVECLRPILFHFQCLAIPANFIPLGNCGVQNAVLGTSVLRSDSFPFFVLTQCLFRHRLLDSIQFSHCLLLGQKLCSPVPISSLLMTDDSICTRSVCALMIDDRITLFRSY